ncbi:PAS domain-containing hybrid sensor histidine kinase/response regulator [Belnapia rosea]|uniref:PAS domain-containing hybrid sensor histidine kinase/response regulator n=1 Tax=Belnapia rosea TaxID=938405 RepID=UPI0008914D58|nr:PAS domain-containing hybrid sensor histidine kinase/response regulator [Belnapia rosea]SDB73817.1 PAS domain S-box-containing protein [Belnapia rosea]
MEEDLEDLFENAPCGYVSAGPNGRISKVNRTLAAWLGYERGQLVGRRFQDLLNIAGKIYYETHFAPLLRMQGFFNEVALDLIRQDGQVLPVLVNAIERRDAVGKVRCIRITVFNASDRRRYERELLEARRVAEAASNEVRELNLTLEARIAEAVEQRMEAEEALRQAHKMEAIGQLTGGIAHDFNNLLTGIIGSLELLNTRISQGRLNDVDRYISAARGAAKRAATLTHRLLAFARRQVLDPKSTNINCLVVGMEELIRRTMGQAIEIEVVGSAGLWNTLIDPNQLENALLNLCINARDAMPNGGRLTIETANRWLDDRTALERDLPAGQYVALSVTDTGTGMPPEVIRRAFDPFFTTKPIGKGTGLGLSMIHGFVRQSGGQVRIYSEIGQGTTMCLYLPRHYGAKEGTETSAVVAEARSAEAGETVLVVDDEPTVRMLVTEVLEELGYIAVEASDGAAGLKVLQSNARVDLLVTDVAMPGGMNGRQLADTASKLRPELPVLFITGYAENALIGNGQLVPNMQVVTKPFTVEALAVRIRDLLSKQ